VQFDRRIAVLTRLYVDNYKSLVNFDLKLGKEHLFLGRNGTGKSTVFDLLEGIVDLLVNKASIESVFGIDSINRWGGRTVQSFRLESVVGNDVYKYALEIENEGKCQVKREEVWQNDFPLMMFDGTDLLIYRDDGQSSKVLAQNDRLLISSIPAQSRVSRLDAAMSRLFNVIVIRLIPSVMKDESDGEDQLPSVDMANAASFYRHLLQDKPDEMESLRESLRASIDGFDSLRLEVAGKSRILKARFRGDADDRKSKTVEFLFGELSDGQRSLIALYMILHARSDHEATVCLDEPENYLALREIQPLLSSFREQPNTQLLVISHHPEIINELAREHGVLFERMPGGSIRTSPWRAPTEETMTPAELIARGWENGG
jgi:predicted ATPase